MTDWTDERTALTTRLWLEGLSASQIAKQLGGVTRNAVIGKVHHLHLRRRPADARRIREGGMNHLPPWSAERFETAKKLWMAGDSATMIAEHLNCGLTRSAVLGKIHRAGLASEGRARPAAPAARVAKPRPIAAPWFPKPAAPTRAKPAAAILAPASAPIPPRCTADLLQIETLDAHTCKWPIGDPKLEGFGFCGAHKPAETVYCAEHAPIAVKPQTPAKRAAAKKLYAYLAERA